MSQRHSGYAHRKGREDAPPDPGIIPGGIRDRAMRAVMERGPRPEDKRKTRTSQKFWAALKERT